MEDKELEIYEYLFDEEKMAGIFGYGIVAEPANNVQCYFFNEEVEEEIIITKMSSEEKRLLTSAMLVPNKKIYRKDVAGNGPGYVYFTEEIIEKLSQKFARDNNGAEATLNHGNKLEGVYVVESWLVKDPEMDKSRSLGFTTEDIPAGTWMCTIKIDNDDLWENYIKTGVLSGLSVEGELATKKIDKVIMTRRQLNEVIQMSIQKVAMATGMNEFITKDEVKIYSDELILENVITDAEGNPLADGEFEIDGKNYQTDGQGVIVDIKEVEKEEEVELDDESVQKIADLEAKVEEQAKTIADLEAKLVEAEAKLVKSEKDVVEMSLQTPAGKGVKNAPKQNAPEEKPATGVLAAFRNAIKK